jgi:molecular chaperone GrpE
MAHEPDITQEQPGAGADASAPEAPAPAEEEAAPEAAAPAGDGGAPEDGAPEEPAAPQERDVEADLAELTARRDEYLALAQRTQADFENYRKRMAKEVRVAEARGKGKLARELLPALDTLHLALERSGPEAEGPLGEGVRLVLGELIAALGRAGIEAYSPEGESFDPQVHEAVGQRPAEDGEQAGTVVEVMQQGYRHGETVLRPARVFVAG